MTNKKTKPHPIQPLELDNHGVLRFKENKIVSYLLKHGGIDLNMLAVLDFTPEDHQQFAQLIGYSLGGYGDLSYVTDDAYEAAAATREIEDPRDAEIAVLKETLHAIRRGLRKPIAELYGKHPDDLMETEDEHR
jgi:hypothetical protein